MDKSYSTIPVPIKNTENDVSYALALVRQMFIPHERHQAFKKTPGFHWDLRRMIQANLHVRDGSSHVRGVALIVLAGPRVPERVVAAADEKETSGLGRQSFPEGRGIDVGHVADGPGLSCGAEHCRQSSQILVGPLTDTPWLEIPPVVTLAVVSKVTHAIQVVDHGI